MTTVFSPARELRADRFHTGVRLAAMLAWFASIILVFLLLRLVISAVAGSVSGVGILLVAVLALFLAQPLALLAEKQLLARWPSGRAVQLAPARLMWQDKGQAADIDLRQKVNFWRWRFEIRRRRGGRIPSGHHCFAIRLVQGDAALSLYAFLPPATAEAIAARFPFYELRRSNDAGKLALGGREAVYLAAENARWDSGAELEVADFEALLAHLDEHLPEFRLASTSGG